MSAITSLQPYIRKSYEIITIQIAHMKSVKEVNPTITGINVTKHDISLQFFCIEVLLRMLNSSWNWIIAGIYFQMECDP